MHHTSIAKALSIALLLSCAANVNAMSKKEQARARNKAAVQGVTTAIAHAGPMGTDHIERPSGKTSPELQAAAAAAELTQEAFAAEPANAAPQAPVKEAVAQLIAQAPVAQEVPNNASSIKSLLGKELVALYNTDEQPLVQKPMWGKTDATVPYKDEGRLITGLGKNDIHYLKDVQARQDLNRTLNHICAGIIQKIKEQSTLDQETGTRAFSVQQIELILESQFPRAMELNKILALCKMRIEAKQEPVLYPQEDAKELAQQCFAALSQLQLERKRIREKEENDRIRQIKEGQRMAYQMRLTADKGTISEDEYSDEFIFDKTTV